MDTRPVLDESAAQLLRQQIARDEAAAARRRGGVPLEVEGFVPEPIPEDESLPHRVSRTIRDGERRARLAAKQRAEQPPPGPSPEEVERRRRNDAQFNALRNGWFSLQGPQWKGVVDLLLHADERAGLDQRLTAAVKDRTAATERHREATAEAERVRSSLEALESELRAEAAAASSKAAEVAQAVARGDLPRSAIESEIKRSTAARARVAPLEQLAEAHRQQLAVAEESAKGTAAALEQAGREVLVRELDQARQAALLAATEVIKPLLTTVRAALEAFASKEAELRTAMNDEQRGLDLTFKQKSPRETRPRAALIFELLRFLGVGRQDISLLLQKVEPIE